MIINNYKIISVISSGSFGNVYKCKLNDKLYALKEDNNFKLLKYEANIYKELKNLDNISMLYDFFVNDNNYYLVLDYYEITLPQFKTRFYTSKDYLLKLNTIFKIIIDTIEHIHKNGILHRDIKPSNICFDKNYEPYIIDFGLAKHFITNNKHIQEKKINSIIGSYNFVSKNVINLIEPSRRDDLESVVLTFIYMIMSNDYYNKYDTLSLELKKDIVYIQDILTRDNVLLETNNNIYNSILYIRRLKFSQEPNYNYLKNRLS